MKKRAGVMLPWLKNHSSMDIDILKCWVFYLPQEFSTLGITAVYNPIHMKNTKTNLVPQNHHPSEKSTSVPWMKRVLPASHPEHLLQEHHQESDDQLHFCLVWGLQGLRMKCPCRQWWGHDYWEPTPLWGIGQKHCLTRAWCLSPYSSPPWTFFQSDLW